jgi:superkiller protein 3
VLASACASSNAESPGPSQPAAQAAPPPRRPGPKASGGGPSGAQLEKAKKAARDGDLDGASTAVKEALAQDDKNEAAYLLLASLCSMKGDKDCVEQVCEQGLAALPESSGLLHARGMFLLENQKLDPAVVDLEKAHGLSQGKDPEIEADLAYAYVFANRLDDAERLANAARKLAPGSFAAAFTLGEALFRKERIKEALAAYQDAVKLSPNDETALRRLALALGKDDQHQPALEVYDQLLKTTPDPMLHAARAGELIKLGRPKEAVDAMKEALKLAPNEPKLLELLLRAQDAAGDKKGAKATRAQIKGLGPH